MEEYESAAGLGSCAVVYDRVSFGENLRRKFEGRTYDLFVLTRLKDQPKQILQSAFAITMSGGDISILRLAPDGGFYVSK